MVEQSYVERALAAYYREMVRQRRAGIHLDLPSSSGTYKEEWDGKDYILVRNGYRTLAVYRIKPDGFLRRLKRWPKAIDPTTS
jgi:hypothetical protein